MSMVSSSLLLLQLLLFLAAIVGVTVTEAMSVAQDSGHSEGGVKVKERGFFLVCYRLF